MVSNSAPIPPVLGSSWVNDDVYLFITQQAWLVEGASALLYIARTLVIHIPHGGDNSLFNSITLKAIQFDHLHPSGGSYAALHALKSDLNMKHKILREFQSYADEKIQWESNKKVQEPSSAPSRGNAQIASGNEEVYKTVSFKELICQTWGALEKIFDRQIKKAVDLSVKQLQIHSRIV